MNYRRKYDPTPLCSGGSRGVTSHVTPMARQPISCYYYALKQFIAVNIRCHVTRRLCAACVCVCVCVCGVLLFYPLLISFRFLVRTWGICIVFGEGADAGEGGISRSCSHSYHPYLVGLNRKNCRRY